MQKKSDSSKSLPAKLFMLWVLLLPFHSIYIYGNLTLDSMLAPIVILLSFFNTSKLGHIPDHKYVGRVNNLTWLFFFVSIYLLSYIPSLLQNGEPFGARLWDILISIGYFLLPVLYIKDINFLRKVNSLIIIVLVIGSLSVILVSFGLLVLPYSRFEASRLGISWLPKSIGFFSNYGDLALLSAYTLLLTIWVNKKYYFFGYGGKLIKTVIIVSVFLGIIGSQSRNVVLTIAAALGAFYFYKNFYGRTSSLVRIVSFFIVFISLIIIILFFDNIVEWVSLLGGKNAERTANTRVETYSMAWMLFKSSPIIGIDYKTYLNNAPLIDGLHDMWLGLALRGGLLSLISFLLLYINVSIKTVKRISNTTLGNEAAISAAFLISILIAASFYVANRSVIFWFLLGYASTVHCLYYPVRKSSNDFKINKKNINLVK